MSDPPGGDIEWSGRQHTSVGLLSRDRPKQSPLEHLALGLQACVRMTAMISFSRCPALCVYEIRHSVMVFDDTHVSKQATRADMVDPFQSLRRSATAHPVDDPRRAGRGLTCRSVGPYDGVAKVFRRR